MPGHRAFCMMPSALHDRRQPSRSVKSPTRCSKTRPLTDFRTVLRASPVSFELLIPSPEPTRNATISAIPPEVRRQSAIKAVTMAETRRGAPGSPEPRRTGSPALHPPGKGGLGRSGTIPA